MSPQKTRIFLLFYFGKHVKTVKEVYTGRNLLENVQKSASQFEKRKMFLSSFQATKQFKRHAVTVVTA